MSSSESDCGLERYSSIDSIDNIYDEVPEDKKFKINLLTLGKVKDRFSYTLKKGQELPYTRVLKGNDKQCRFKLILTMFLCEY